MTMTRKEFLRVGLYGGASALLLPRGVAALQVSGPPLDLVVTGGRIVDGTGRAPFEASIGIRDGRIVDIGNIPAGAARQAIDAGGKAVCPGFLDPHAHEEILMLARESHVDLLVLAANLRQFTGRPFLGHGVEYLLEEAEATVVVVTAPPGWGLRRV